MTISPVPRCDGETYPSSYTQTAMWLADRMRPDRSTMNILIAIRLLGSLDREALAGAVADLVARHEILHTVFVELGGELRQLVRPSRSVPVSEVDLRQVPEDERETVAHEVADTLIRQRFDLANGPLLRASLARLGEHDHLLLMVWHHIIHDGWSINLALAELRHHYARRRGEPVPELAPPPIQYIDYVLWQRERVASGTFDAAATRRREELSAPRPDAVLPCVPARPGGPSRGARLFTVLPTDLIRRLRQAARPLRTTPFHVLLSGYLAVLARHTGCADLTVGVVVSGRSQPELEPLIGAFVNTMPVRVTVDEATTFRSLVAAVKPETLRVLADQEMPYELFGLGDSGPPLRFACITQERAGDRSGWSGLTEVPWFHDIDDAVFDFSVGGVPVAGGLEVTVQYRTDLFDEATVERFGAHLRRMLEAMAEQPDRPVSRLPVLTDAERNRALQDWNPPLPAAPPPDVLATIAEQSDRTPEAVALVDADGRTLSYRQLLRRAGQLANRLRERGLRPGERIAVLADRSPEAVVGILGCWAARAAFVPVSVEAPAARITDQLADAGARLALTTTDRAGLVPDGVQAVDLTDLAGDGSEPSPPQPDDLAYVIYTSGSTGAPKGVEVTRANLATTAWAWQQVLPDPPAGMRLLQSADLAFDVFVSDLVRALCRGGALVFCPREVLLDPPRLQEFMIRHAVTAAFLVPAVARLLAAHLNTTGGKLEFLDLLVFGVERMSTGEFAEFVELVGPHTTVLNSYGVTEATIDNTVYRGPVPPGPPDTTMPIGRPLPGTLAYILDPQGQPCPIGATGELHLGGDTVARGYLGAPELTAARFGPNPFVTGGRLYRTGDLARYHPDGTIELVGRVDHQVKVRGRRIEPGEVEAALRELPGVAECVVVARELVPVSLDSGRLTGGDGDPQLVGYLVTGGEPDLEEVRSRLALRLPAYLIPAAFVVLPALPRNANGKLDRDALPPPDPAQASGPAYAAPRSPAESRLVQIWQTLLGADRIGVHDGFVARGGHSLIAARLVGEVRAAFGVELPLPAVFENGTVAGQARVIEELLAAELAEMSEEDALRLLASAESAP